MMAVGEHATRSVSEDGGETLTSSPAVIFEEDLFIPVGVSDLGRFRCWTADESFPERGRIDFAISSSAGSMTWRAGPDKLMASSPRQSAEKRPHPRPVSLPHPRRERGDKKRNALTQGVALG
jgi:hypothetical protein